MVFSGRNANQKKKTSTEAAGFSTLEGRVFSRGNGKTAAWEGVDFFGGKNPGLGATWEFRAIGHLEVGRKTRPVLPSHLGVFVEG